MRDYLEELLEEPVEEDVLSLPQSARRADSSLVRGSLGAVGTGGEIPQSALLTAPLVRGPRVTEENPTTGCAGPPPLSREARGTREQNPPVSFADSPLSKGAKGSAVEALVGKLRKGAMAAAYRASAPAVLEVPERSYVREKSLLELDAAVRRDARRYDGEMTLY